MAQTETVIQIWLEVRLSNIADDGPKRTQMMVDREIRTPTVPSLIDTVVKLDLSMDGTLRKEVETTLDRILFGERKYWECWLEGIITGRELCNILLAHVQTTIEHHTGHPPSVEALEVITPDFEIVLFGSRLADEEPVR